MLVIVRVSGELPVGQLRNEQLSDRRDGRGVRQRRGLQHQPPGLQQLLIESTNAAWR